MPPLATDTAVRVETNGQTLVVSIPCVAYTSPAMTNAVTFPDRITANRTYYIAKDQSGSYAISVKQPDGSELHGRVEALYSGLLVIAPLPSTAQVAVDLGYESLDIANVLDYGAVGDGVTDDAAAFTAALTSGATAVYAPKASWGYAIGSTINIPGQVKLFSHVGGLGAILKKRFNGTMFTMSGRYSTMENLWIDGGGHLGHTGLGVSITEPVGTGGYNRIINCQVANTEGPALYFGKDGGYYFNATNSNFGRTNAVEGSGLYSIVFDTATQGTSWPRSFTNCNNSGVNGFDFGGCNNVYYSGGVIGDSLFRTQSTRVMINTCRWTHTDPITVYGTEHVIANNSLAEPLTLGAGATRCVVGPNSGSASSIVVTDNSGNATNIIHSG